jgi:diaminopimelate epimerase
MIPFFKLSGSGNDFIAVIEPGEPLGHELIRRWCRRGIALGADGVFTLRRSAGGAVMDYFNADGFAADLCLNGTRCAARLAFHLGWAKETVGIATGAGDVVAWDCGPSAVAVEIPVPAEAPEPLALGIAGETHDGFRLTVGVPHFVLPWSEGLAGAPVRTLGRQIRNAETFQPSGTNVNFVRFGSPHRLQLRTYERGVEDETLSCGSGVVASAAVGLATGRLELPVEIETQSGFVLRLSAGPAPGRWRLAGDARIVARGELTPEAAVEVPPPSWMRG